MSLRSTVSNILETTNSKINSFKNTEVGRIPTDWEVVSLKDVASFGGGTTPPRKDFEKFYASGVHPWVKTLDLNDGYISTTEEKVTEAALSETSLKMHPAGTVLVAMYGGFNQIGRTGLIQVSAAINQALVAVITKKERLVPAYLLNLLNYKVDYWKTVASSSRKDPNITSNDVKSFLLPLPCVIEQTAIANALSDVDALIQELEKLIAKKQAIKTATMQQLLTGRTRLPAFAYHPDGRKKGYKPSELGEIPEDWEVVSFEQLKDKRDGWAITGGPFGSNLKASDYTDDGIRVIQLQNIGDGFFKNSEFVFTSQKKADDLISCNIYPGEIILSKMGDPVARACLIPSFHSRYLMCSDGIRLKVDSQRFSEKFVFYFLNFPLFRNQALDASTGSTRKRIGLSELRDLLLFSPSKEEQTDIATTLSNMDDEIQSLEQRLNKTRQIKQGMMQELLTGKTRLVKPAELA
jgi:type I restriction enzyme S subunit